MHVHSSERQSEYDDEHDYIADDHHLKKNEVRTFWVVVLTAAMMCVEIVAGYLTGSMALLADGWHMASHATALFIALMAYRLARSTTTRQKFSFGAGKFIPLGGYTSAIVLGFVALLMSIESSQRLRNPVPIEFNDALAVAVVGLIVNIVSAFILSGSGAEEEYHSHDHHSGHHHHDHNIRGAYAHVIADALTSVLAILALLIGKYFNAYWLDPIVGIVGSIVILRWGWALARDTAWELLDGHAKSVDREELISLLERSGTKVADLHVWRIAPKATACEIIIETDKLRGADYYQGLIPPRFHIRHLVIEERVR